MSDDVLDTIGRELRRSQDAALRLRPLPPLAPAQAARLPWALALVPALAAALVVIVVLTRPAPPLVQQRGDTLTFSDGSRATVAGQVTLRFADARGATFVITGNGSVAGELSSHTGTSALWAVEAGPWAVRSTGARLDVTAADGGIVLHVLGGTALVSGPRGEESLAAGATFRDHEVHPDAHVEAQVPPTAATPTPTPQTTRAPPAAAPASPVRAAPADEASPPAGDAQAAGPLADDVTDAPASPTWQDLARADRHAEAVTAARALGLDDVLAGVSAADCLLLGTSARLALDTAVAERAYAAVRARFPRTVDAARAAFFLARLAVDIRGDDEGATRLLRLALAEAPGFELAQEARGRLVETLARLGRRDEARDAARDYLAHHPEGPHAALARAQLR